jgi:hypothetical protein
MKKIPRTRSKIHRTMKRGQQTSPRRTRECPGDAASAVLSRSTRLPEYQGLVSYRAYRLKDTEAVIDEKDTGRVNGILKRMKHHFSYSFGGEVQLKVLDF